MDLTLRRGTDPDAVAVSALYLRARKAANATIPMTAHTDDETRRWIAERVVPHTELWVAEDDGGALVAYWYSIKTGSISSMSNRL